MSRLHRYKHALLSGYAVLLTNIVYTLASVPLALVYLSRPEFGLWALMTQIGGYISLVDLGMSGSVSRILVDYKDNRNDGRYGSTILTFALSSLVQGGIVLIAGSVLAVLGGKLLRVPPPLQHQFMWLLLGQAGLQAFVFATRTFSVVLTAHQRYDVVNYSQLALFAVNYALLWAGLRLGFGVYSSLFSQATAQILGIVINCWWCFGLKLFPSSGEWGKPTRERFNEVFSFGKDVFLLVLGSQMISASQAILVTPILGVEAAGVWSVCTRAFTLVSQLVGQVLDYSAIPLSELLVRGESEKFFERFRSITILTASIAVLTAVLFASCNQIFVGVWAKGRYGWPVLNDVLLGLWLVLVSVRRCHCGLLSVRKQLRTVKYVYLMEGCIFVGLAIFTVRNWGYVAVIGSSIVATSLMSFAYGLHRTKIDFNLKWKELLKWFGPATRLALFLLPWLLLLWVLSKNFSPFSRLAILAIGGGVVGAAVLCRCGLDPHLQQRLGSLLPTSLQGLFGIKAETT